MSGQQDPNGSGLTRCSGESVGRLESKDLLVGRGTVDPKERGNLDLGGRDAVHFGVIVDVGGESSLLAREAYVRQALTSTGTNSWAGSSVCRSAVRTFLGSRFSRRISTRTVCSSSSEEVGQ